MSQPTATWTKRYLGLCKHVAQWSKDPSTKVGACIVSPRRKSIVSLGFNGLPSRVLDTPSRLSDRETKYKMVVHAERNALLFADRPVEGCFLYTWPFMPCSQCAGMIIQAGISVVIAPITPPEIDARWHADLQLTQEMFREAKVILDLTSVRVE